MSAQYDSADYLNKVDAWWRAANYISVAQMYLKDNPLLMRPIQASDVKAHPIGHWGTIAGQNFIYAHLNRAINKYDFEYVLHRRSRTRRPSDGVKLIS